MGFPAGVFDTGEDSNAEPLGKGPRRGEGSTVHGAVVQLHHKPTRKDQVGRSGQKPRKYGKGSFELLNEIFPKRYLLSPTTCTIRALKLSRRHEDIPWLPKLSISWDGALSETMKAGMGGKDPRCERFETLGVSEGDSSDLKKAST